MTEFRLPDLGEGLTEAEIVDWHVGPGDRVVANQPLVSVETDKAIVEIPAPQAAVVAELAAEVGQVVPVGAVLLRFEAVSRPDEGTVVGDIEHVERPSVQHATGVAPEGGQDRAPGAPGIHATPAARRLATERGVDLAGLTGTGPGGAIGREDVEATEGATVSTGRGVERLSGVRRAMALAMTRAGDEVVPATVTEMVEVDDGFASADITARLARAMGRASRVEPALNAWYDARSGRRTLHDAVDLGIAVDTPGGLLVPVVRDVASLDDDGLVREIGKLVESARKRSLAPEQLRGATTTLSNFGMMGGLFANLVVVPPQVAILGAGRLHRGVVARELEPATGLLLPVSLTFDHRVVSGAEAARFLKAVIEDLGVES